MKVMVSTNYLHCEALLLKPFAMIVLGPGRKRPDGGNGGRGGDVYVIADKVWDEYLYDYDMKDNYLVSSNFNPQDMSSFTMQTFHYNGGAGTHGGSGGLTGKRGDL